jgi:hypothetical protein
MWRLILNFFLTRSLILYSSLKFLCISSKNIQIIILILNTLRGCSVRIQNTPRATRRESYWLIQGEANFIGCHPVGAFFSCSSNIMVAARVALCTFKMSRKLLKAHSKYGESCSILSYWRPEQHNRPL